VDTDMQFQKIMQYTVLRQLVSWRFESYISCEDVKLYYLSLLLTNDRIKKSLSEREALLISLLENKEI